VKLEKDIQKRIENKLYYNKDLSMLMVCTDVNPFPTDKRYGWFGILFPLKNFNEFDHFLWGHVISPTLFVATSNKKRAVIKKSFKIKDIEKKYL
jgi:hypothetical protein